MYPELYIQANSTATQVKPLNRLAYLVFLPPFLIAWSWAADGLVAPSIAMPSAVGLAIAALGLFLVASGIAALRPGVDGEPLIRKVVPHPIFTGITMLCGGGSILLQSGAGLWLVTPMVCLGFAAIVIGGERPANVQNYIIPLPGDEAPAGKSRIFAYTCVLLPWIVLYEAVIFLGPTPDSVRTQFAFEHSLPVIEWTQVIYSTPYVLVCLVPLLAKTRTQLRTFTRGSLISMAAVFPMYLTLPFISPHREFTAHTVFGHLLQSERALDGAGAAFPSYHVLWALIAAQTLALIYPSLAALWKLWPVLVGVSCVTTGSHGILDVIAAFAVFALLQRVPSGWGTPRTLTLLWGIASTMALLRLSTLGADPRLILGIGLMMTSAAIIARKQWRAGSLLALAGVLATVIH